jgi:uncharacterized protein (TIGR02246 family)
MRYGVPITSFQPEGIIMKTRTYVGIAVAMLAVLAGLWIADRGSVTAQEAKAPKGAKAKRQPAAATDREADNEAIRRSARDFAAAFEKGDAKAVAAFWTEGGEYYDDSGEVLRGRAAIEKAFADHFKEERNKMEIDVQSIRFPSRDTAIEEGIVRVNPVGNNELPTSTWYSLIHVREDGQWRIITSREWGAADHKLEDLAWLIGDWAAKSKDNEFKMSFEWTDKKVQIHNHFSVKQGGRVTSSGTQTIAVDPKTGQLRSWMFDDQGGHGQSLWFRDQNRWVLDSTSVLGDGREASATNVISRLGEDEFIWRSTNRTVVTSDVPDTTPIKVSRVKAAK